MGRAQAHSAEAKPITAGSVFVVMGFAALYPSYGLGDQSADFACPTGLNTFSTLSSTDSDPMATPK